MKKLTLSVLLCCECKERKEKEEKSDQSQISSKPRCYLYFKLHLTVKATVLDSLHSTVSSHPTDGKKEKIVHIESKSGLIRGMKFITDIKRAEYSIEK